MTKAMTMERATTESTERPRGLPGRPWRLVTILLGCLILAIAAASAAALVFNERVRDVTERALRHDLEVEDEGDDVRIAVLDLRHYHRNIIFEGVTPGGISAYNEGYDALVDELDDLERLDLAKYEVPQPAEVSQLAAQYYTDFRAAMALYDDDRTAFNRASNEGLQRISDLDRAAHQIDNLGEDLAQDSLARVDGATSTERLVLVLMLPGIGLVGGGVGWGAWRVLRRMEALFEREQATAQELEHALRTLELALRTKTDFIADASHELLTPLTVIGGNAEIGLSLPDQCGHREVLEEIAAETNRMSRLVEDLLFLARSDAGMAALEREYIPARRLLTQVAKRAEVLAQQHGACLTVEQAVAGHLDADPARVEQAVLILVDNAAKHSPPDAPVVLRSRVTGTELAIEVVDEGPGIPADELPLVFDRFYQVGQRRTRKRGRAGLGLSIAKTIVEAHGGAIGVDSQPGRGTRMTITLPLAAAEAPAAMKSDRMLVPA
jgi:two-component system sensor histidine kinase VicK